STARAQRSPCWRRRQRSSSRAMSPGPAWVPARRPLAARRLLPRPLSLAGARPAAPPGLRPRLVTPPTAPAGLTTKAPAPASTHPDPARNPPPRRDAPARVMPPRVGRAHGAGKPPVTGAQRRFDLLKLAPFVLRERHSALR